MIIIKYLFLFILFIILITYYNRNILKGTISLEFPNYLALGIALYMLLPLLEVIVKGEGTVYNFNFLNDSIVVLISILFGTYLGTLKFRNSYKLNINNTNTTIFKILNNSPRYELCIVVFSTILCAFFMNINIIVNKGGWINYFTTSYGALAGIEENTIITSTIYSLIAYALIFNNSEFVKNIMVRRLANLSTIFFSGLFILGGNRNLALMIIMAFLWATLRKKKFKILTMLALLIVAFIGLGFVAIGREYGIVNFFSGKVDLDMQNVLGYVLSFSKGELGTTMKFSYYSEFINEGFQFPHKYGYSYTIGALLNVIPKSLYTERGLAVADLFTRYGYSQYDGFGIGFSPIFEAKINFGHVWWIVFILIGYFVRKISYSHNKGIQSHYLLQGIIASIVFNFFRIDFATFFKFFSMIFVFSFLFLWLLCKCRIYVTSYNLTYNNPKTEIIST